MANPKFSFENINGTKVMRIKHHPLMSSGVWNDWYYDESELSEAFKRTDWNDKQIRNLFFDHEDTSAKNWIGLIENPSYEKPTVYGDLIIANEEAQKALILGAKFGISPKIVGKGEEGSVKQFDFRNWSIVTDPACKTTYLNSAKKEDNSISLIPNEFFILEKNTGDKMDAEIEKAAPAEPAKEEKPLTRDEIKAMIGATVKESLPKEAEKAAEPASEVEVVGKYSNSDKEAKFDRMIKRLSSRGIVNKEFVNFAKTYKAENSDADFKEVIQAWNLKERERQIDERVEQKLASKETGKKISTNAEAAPADKVNDTGFADVDVAMLNYLQGDYKGAPLTLELQMVPKKGLTGLRVFELSATATTSSSVRGTAFSSYPYPLQPILYLRSAIDAAKERMMFQQALNQYTLPVGHKDITVPYRTTYLGAGSWETSTAEYAAGSEIAWTQVNTADGKLITPTQYNYGIALSNFAIRTSALNEVQYMREELSYMYENALDSDARDAIFGTVNASDAATAPTEMADATRGAQTIFGGIATDADNSLNSGDVLTLAMFAKARRLLMSNIGYYWSSNTWTKSSTAKNAWMPTAGEPFLCYIAPEQEEAFLNETKFTNASEYGSNEILLNGEIGKYIGVKILTTTKVPSFKSGDEIKVATAQDTVDTTGHICGMVKAGVCGAQVFGLSPNVSVFDWPNADQVRMKLSMAYASDDIMSDSIVRMVVADE